jgi:hypothetical protein
LLQHFFPAFFDLNIHRWPFLSPCPLAAGRRPKIIKTADRKTGLAP